MILKDGRVYTSYSQLDKYLKCPFSWKLRYIDKIKDEVKSKHLDYGNIIHSTFEFIFSYYASFGELPPHEMSYKEFEDNVIKFDLKCDNDTEFDDWLNMAYDSIDSIYERTGIYKEILHPSTEIVGIELPFELKVEMPEREFYDKDGEVVESDEVVVVGFIDLLLKTPDGYIVIDHKSGSKKFDKKKLRNDLQFPIYSLAVNQMYGEYPVKGYYNFTKLGIHQEVLFAEEITADMETAMDKRSPDKIYFRDPDSALRDMRQVFNQMYNKTHEAKPSFLCNWCDYKDICPAINHKSKEKKDD